MAVAEARTRRMGRVAMIRQAHVGRTQAYRGRARAVWALLVVGVIGMAPDVQARISRERDDHTVELTVGGSQTVRVGGTIDRVVVGDPTVAEVTALPGSQLLVTAKIAGETQLTVFSRANGATIYRILASMPVAMLQQALHEAFPNEDDLQVHAAGGAVYLSGMVSDAATVEAAGRLTQSMLATSSRKIAEVVNLTTIAASQQVQVGLKFVEVSRTSLRQLGFNAWVSSQRDAGSMFGPNSPQNYYDPSQNFIGPTPGNANASALPMLVSPVQGAFALSFATARGAAPLSATLSLLEGRGVAKTLSEPTLVANSGEKAHFIVGGEYPIPVPDPLGRVIIQFKPYGAQLTFTPTVVSQDNIHLTLDSIVSDIDKQNTTTVGANQVPGIITRESSTSVRMRDGQSFAIAGLLSDRITAQDNHVPLLGELPLIGALFRSTNYSRSQQELVVLVSVRLVKPMDAGEVPPLLHEDEFNDPGDLQLFLLGSIDNTGAARAKTAQARTTAPVAPGFAPRRPAAQPTPAPVVPPRAQGNPGGAVGFSR